MKYILIDSSDYLSCEFVSDSRILMRVPAESTYSLSLPLYFNLRFGDDVFLVTPFDTTFFLDSVVHTLEVVI